MSQVRNAILFSVLNQYSLQIVNIVSIAIIARLLTPEAIGVFSVATTLAFVAVEIRALGVAEYLVREKEIDTEKIRSVLGVMMIMSWGLAVVFIAAAPWVAEFYGQPDLRNILWIITIPFFIAPYASIPFALLTREMQFGAILTVNLLGSLARNGVSIGLVLAGAGYYGLAWGAFAGVLVEFLAITWHRPALMSWKPTFHGLTRVFRSGAQIGVGRLLNTTSQNSSDLVLGRMASMADVGHFSRGLGLILFLNNLLIKAVGPVSLPHLSKVVREGGDIGEAYLHSITLVGAFTLPIFAVVSVASFSMITALFGSQWGDSVHVASILCIWAMLQSVHCFSTQALLAVSKERLVLVREAISFAVKIVIMILAVSFGLEAVAWGFVLSGFIDFVVTTWIMMRTHHITPGRLLSAFLPNILVAGACWLLLTIMHEAIVFEAMNSWLALLLIAAAMVPTWLVALKLTGNKMWPFVWGGIGKVVGFGVGRLNFR